MNSMHRLLLPLLALGLFAVPSARAQFYDLDGAYQCVTAPNAGCNDRLTEPEKSALPPTPKAEAPRLEDVIARVKKHTASAADIHLLESAVAAKDTRAVEVLAWCKLNGIAMPADPMSAYWLYGEAASLGVTNARKNQLAIYKTRLTSEQRQQVLVKESTQ